MSSKNRPHRCGQPNDPRGRRNSGLRRRQDPATHADGARPPSTCGPTPAATTPSWESSTRSSTTSTPARTSTSSRSPTSRRTRTTTPSSRRRRRTTCRASSTSTVRTSPTGRGPATSSRSGSPMTPTKASCRARSARSTARCTRTASSTSRSPCSAASRRSTTPASASRRSTSRGPATSSTTRWRRSTRSGQFDYAVDFGTGGGGEWIPYAYSPLLQSFGGDLIDRSDFQTADGALNGPEALEWATWFRGLVDSGYMAQTSGDGRDGRLRQRQRAASSTPATGPTPPSVRRSTTPWCCRRRTSATARRSVPARGSGV